MYLSRSVEATLIDLAWGPGRLDEGWCLRCGKGVSEKLFFCRGTCTVTAGQPEPRNPKPETRNLKPETRNPKPQPEPETRNLKPGTRNQEPETRKLRPETRNPKPETSTGTRNPEPETRNLKPGTRISKAETRNPKPETRAPKLETRNRWRLKTGTGSEDLAPNSGGRSHRAGAWSTGVLPPVSLWPSREPLTSRELCPKKSKPKQ
jgi:hypothetical protein